MATQAAVSRAVALQHLRRLFVPGAIAAQAIAATKPAAHFNSGLGALPYYYLADVEAAALAIIDGAPIDAIGGE